MTISRADTLTTVRKKQEYFSDFLDNFFKTPVGDDLARVTNERSVDQALKNLVKTNMGERLFQPTVGGDVYNSLFEQNGIVEGTILEFNILNMIKYNEPRVNVLDVTVDTEKEENTLEISIIYSLINNPDPTTLTFLLKRVR